MESDIRHRNRSKARAHDEWLKIIADKENWAGECGPLTNPKRCFIPSWMTCAARVKNVVENYELKQTERRMKERKMTEDEEGQLASEARLGFHARLALVDMQSISRAYAPGALTSTDDAPASTTLLLQAAHMAEWAPKESSPGKGDAETLAGTPREKALAMFDLRGPQNSMMRTETKDWTNLETKFAARVGLLVTSMETYCKHSLPKDASEFDVAVERLPLSLLWLNATPVVKQHGDKADVTLEKISEQVARTQHRLVFSKGHRVPKGN